MPCLEGRPHRWVRGAGRPAWWDPRCSVCEWDRSETWHHHGLLCEYETGKYVPECEFILERNARRRVRDEHYVAWLTVQREVWRRQDERRKEREAKWQRVSETYQAAQRQRQETRRQRTRLREGAATLTALRQHLRRGVRSSLLLVSAPETTSRT